MSWLRPLRFTSVRRPLQRGLVLGSLLAGLGALGACQSSPAPTADPGGKSAQTEEEEACLLIDGEMVCSVCAMTDPEPPLDPGTDPNTLDWCSGEEGGGGSGGGDGCDAAPWDEADWDETCWVEGSNCEEAGSGGGPTLGVGGNSEGATSGAGDPWGGMGGAGAASPSGGAGAGEANPSVGGGPAMMPQQAGGACVPKTWADYWGKWCDISKPEGQAWCRGDAGSGPPANIAAGIGADFSYSCCQFSWSGNTWTRLPGHREANGNCTDQGKAWCQSVTRPGWATDVTDTQWAAMAVIPGFFASCMAQMRGWKSTKGWSDYGSAMAVEVTCRTLSRVGCKGIDAMIKSLSALPTPSNLQKRQLEVLLATYAALCTNSN